MPGPRSYDAEVGYRPRSDVGKVRFRARISRRWQRRPFVRINQLSTRPKNRWSSRQTSSGIAFCQVCSSAYQALSFAAASTFKIPSARWPISASASSNGPQPSEQSTHASSLRREMSIAILRARSGSSEWMSKRRPNAQSSSAADARSRSARSRRSPVSRWVRFVHSIQPKAMDSSVSGSISSCYHSRP